MIRKMLLGALLGGGAWACLAQGVVEAGAAAAAGAVAGSAGRSAGSAVGRVFERTGETLARPKRGSSRNAAARGSSKDGRPRQAAAGAREEAPLSPPTPEAFARVEVGMRAQEVDALLGRAFSRILLPVEGRLVEMRRYHAGGRDLGGVKLVDGKVAEVRPSEH